MKVNEDQILLIRLRAFISQLDTMLLCWLNLKKLRTFSPKSMDEIEQKTLETRIGGFFYPPPIKLGEREEAYKLLTSIIPYDNLFISLKIIKPMKYVLDFTSGVGHTEVTSASTCLR